MTELWYNKNKQNSEKNNLNLLHNNWLSICLKMQRRDERMHEINIDSKHIKILCILLMVSSGILTFLGRGTFGLIQGIIGVIAGIEGYYGALEYSIKNIKILFGYLCLSTLFCIIMGVYSQSSVTSYCDIDKTQKQQCVSTVLTWTILYLSIGLVFNVIMIIALLRFYWKIRKVKGTKPERSGSLLD